MTSIILFAPLVGALVCGFGWRLIGESAAPALIEQVRAMIDKHARITAVTDVRTIHTAPDAVFVAVTADFDDTLTMGEGETLVSAIEDELKAAIPALTSVYIRPRKAGT